MMRAKTPGRRGFCSMHRMTLAELLVATAIFSLVIAGTVGLAVYILQRHKEIAGANELRNELGVVIQYLKGDTSYSSLEEMVFYPSPASSFLSISMPILQRDDSYLNTPPIDANGEVEWTHTVIYHIFRTDAGLRQLRRTSIANRDNSLTVDQRYAQLESVVERGDGDHLAKPAGTRVLCRNMKDFRVVLGQSTFDTYDDVSASEHLYMGMQVISPGAHKLTLTAAGKHDSSSGYKIGVDNLTLSQNESRLEGEYLAKYATASGASLSLLQHDEPDWSNGSEVVLGADQAGESVTFTFYNDTWLESTFAQDGAETDGTKLEGCEVTGEDIVLMAGMEDLPMAYGAAGDGEWRKKENIDGYAVRIVVPGEMLKSELPLGGVITQVPKFRVGFTTHLGAGQRLRIAGATIMERSSGPDGVIGTIDELTFSDAVAAGTVIQRSGYVACPNGITFHSDWVEAPFSTEKEYLVTLQIQPLPAILDESWFSTDLDYWEFKDGKERAYFLTPESVGKSLEAPVKRVTWSGFSADDLSSNAGVPCVSSVFVSHPTTGTYTSRIFDTRMISPVFSQYVTKVSRTMNDENHTPGVKILFRSATMADMSDAPDWAEVTPLPATDELSSVDVRSGRYVQFRAAFEASESCLDTSKFHFMALLWPGPTRAVDVSGQFGYGSDRGQFTATIDGHPLTLNNLTYKVKVETMLSGKQQLVRDMNLVVSPRWQ